MSGLLTLAFTGGLLAPVNPCGFALLPAYLTHTVADQPDAPLTRRLAGALGTGAALAIGFAVTLTAAGLAISAGAHELISAAPWLGFIIGLMLVVLGLIGFAGRGPRLRVPTLRGPANGHTVKGPIRWALFGVGYATASLACTFGVLLAVIAQAQATTGLAGQMWVFGAYAAGSVTLLLVLSAAAALAGAALTRWVRGLARQQARITAALLVVTGSYVALYWWPAVTGRAPVGHGLGSIDRWSADTTSWLQAHTTQTALAAAVVLALVTGVGVAVRFRQRRVNPGNHAPVDCCQPAGSDTLSTTAQHRVTTNTGSEPTAPGAANADRPIGRTS